MTLTAVLFDLDDTLFPQAQWLASAWDAVAAAAPSAVDQQSLRRALDEICAEGSAKGGIIDRALERVGAADVPVAPLVEVFRTHVPDRATAYDDAVEALAAVRAQVPVACITDGDPEIQRAKLRLLGLTDAFDAVVLSDEAGREHRKPHPLPFRTALERLGQRDPKRVAMVGDRPDKDVAGAQALGMLTVRVRTGEYADRPDEPPADHVTADVVAAVQWLLPQLGR